MPRHADFSNLSHEDLLHAVSDLVARKRITADEVRTVAGRAGRIAALEAELAALRGGGVTRGPGRPRRAVTATAPSKPAPKRTFTMTPKARAARKLQGRYLGTIRMLSADQKADVKAMATKDGVAEALKLALKYKAEAKKAASAK